MRIIHAVAAAVAFIVALPAAAQTAQTPQAAMAQFSRVEGELVSMTDTDITVRAADGKTSNLALGPNLMIYVSRVIPSSAIKPGDFVATTNVNTSDKRAIAAIMSPPTSSPHGSTKTRCDRTPPMMPPRKAMFISPLSCSGVRCAARGEWS